MLKLIKNKRLENLVKNSNNSVRVRFKYADDFWIKDYLIPLGRDVAENFVKTAIYGYYRDDCDNKNQLVLHGILNGLSLPGFSWVEDGKLLLKGVKMSDPDKAK